ncbi:MAG: hypothetical protein K2N18_03000, partial [Clostridia bacterium]|nr:hypothetical protein [Clostridia bacterium]
MKGDICIMKMRRLNKVLTAVFIVALLALSIALPMVEGGFGRMGFAKPDTPTALAAAPNGPNGTTYGQLASNSTYLITDPEKVTSATITEDTTEITIDTSIPHGTSAKNPYVIDTEARWNQLATDGAADNSTTSGKYYILTADIAFSTTNQFKGVNYFKGTFYGLGHTFSGLRYTTNSTSAWLSIFNNVSNAVITDLNVKDFVINQSNGSNVITFGGIAGLCVGSTKVLNCHTNMTASCIGVNKHGRFGGIIGVSQSSSVIDLLIYKCSSKIDITITTTPKDQAVVRIGGMLAMAVDSTRLTVWHCYGDVKMDVKSNSSCYAGSIVGVLMYPKYAAKVEYCAGRLDSVSSLESAVGTSDDTPPYMIMSLMSVFVRQTSAVTDLPSLTVRHTYTIGGTTYTNKTAQLYAIITNRPFANGSATKTFENVWSGIFQPTTEWGFLYNSAYDTNHTSYSVRIYDIPTQIRDKTCPESTLWTKAGTALPSDIWTNIGVLSANNYSVDNTPFKSTKFTTSDFKVNLYDKKNTGNDALLYTTTYNYNSNPTLTTPSKTGAIFKGYTFD